MLSSRRRRSSSRRGDGRTGIFFPGVVVRTVALAEEFIYHVTAALILHPLLLKRLERLDLILGNDALILVLGVR
jgi:hypothetical protein